MRGRHVVQGQREHARDGRHPLGPQVVVGLGVVGVRGAEDVELHEVEELGEGGGEAAPFVRVDRLPGGRGAGDGRRRVHGPVSGRLPQLPEQSAHEPPILVALGRLFRAGHRSTISNRS